MPPHPSPLGAVGPRRAAPAARPGTSNPLPQWAREASDEVDLDSLAGRVVETDLAAAFESLRGNEEFTARLRASVEENLLHLRQVISGRACASEVELVEPFVLARLQARLRIPQTALQRSYRVGFTAMLDAWSAALVARAEDEDVRRIEALQALNDLTRLLLGYQHHVTSQVAEGFARTDAALSRSRDQVRNGLVRQLLRDDALPPSPADLVLLDYPLEASHLTVLLPRTAEGATRQVLSALRSASHARDVLLHPVDLTSTVVWLAQPGEGWRPEAARDLYTCLTALGVEASISDVGVGLDGFRRGWRQALDTQRVRAAWAGAEATPRVLRHADVHLEILLMADPGAAATFAAAELGGLGGDDELSARLRETVEASFRWGSHVTTASHLHLHEHTVRNRLAKAAELLGRPLTERRTELQVALRMVRLLAQEPH